MAAQLTTRALTVLLWLALAAGPVALMLGLFSGGPAPTAVVAARGDAYAGERAAVGAFAQDVVRVWLTSTQSTDARLKQLVAGGDTVAASETAWAVNDLATAGARRVAKGVWSVTVAATVTDSQSKTAAVRRYFQVPVTIDSSGALLAQTLPAPVAAPADGVAARFGYDFHPSTEDPVAAAAGDFLRALLTGSADVSRYTSPGSPIVAVTPAPYTGLQVRDVTCDVDLSREENRNPADGDRARLLVTAVATQDQNLQIGVTYALSMTARGGRWEISSIDPAPALTPAEAATQQPPDSPVSGTSSSVAPPTNP